jgi:hypothetical protein
LVFLKGRSWTGIEHKIIYLRGIWST